jgi:hypothetical protein
MDTDLLLKAVLAIGLVIILARCTGITRERFTDYVPANRVPANLQLGQMALSVDSGLLPSKERPQLDYGEFKPPIKGLESQTFIRPGLFY